MTAFPSLSETERQPGIPIEHLVAEIVAYPLAAEAALKNPIVSIDPDIKGNTATLWRETERLITRIGPDFSIDMALAVRDHFWFAKETGLSPQEPIPLYVYLRQLSATFLEIRGDRAVPKSPASELVFEREKSVSPSHRSNNTLRWLTYSLPVDLFLGASNTKTCPPNTVEFLPSQLYQNLHDAGFVEPHLHVGGSMQFPEYWVAVLNRIASPRMKADAFKSPGAEMSEGRMMGSWLLRAAIVRLLLARFLYSTRKYSRTFTDWLYQVAYPEIMQSWGNTGLEMLRQGLIELDFGELNDPGQAPQEDFLRGFYRKMINPYLVNRMNDHPEQIHSCDPIATVTRYCPGQSTSPEICFVHRSLFYLEQLKQGKKDRLFESLFWQIIRIRCIFYRHVTQRPMTPGLLWFIRHYDRIKPGRANMDIRLIVRNAAVSCGLGKGLRALEARTIPKESVSSMLELAHQSIDAIRYWNTGNYSSVFFTQQTQELDRPWTSSIRTQSPPIEFGWIFHFPKIRGQATPQGLDKPDWKHSHADPEKPQKTSFLTKHHYQNRYADYYRPQKYKALLLGRLLLQFPRSLKVVRGIDVCTDELGVPTWVLTPILRYLSDVGKTVSQHLKVRFGEDVPSLRKTVHAGEDFVHLLGGLRRIDESVNFFKLGAGDRIGHGMALGTNPVTWANRTGRVAMRIEDRLLDLVWEWSQYSTHMLELVTGRLAYVEREINRLSQKIFDKIYNPYELETLVKHLHDERCLKNIRYPDCEYDRQERTDQQSDYENFNLVKRYLTDPATFQRGHQVEWFSVRPEIEALMMLQHHVRKAIDSLGIVIEVNPSSNLLIGNIADLKNHPFWRLDPPERNSDISPVALCIGSDDPLTFASDLRREYALVYESLIDGGLSAKEAWEWVDRVRRVGMNSRFTLESTAQFKPQSFDRSGYYDRYRILDDQLPRSYWAIDLDRSIKTMP